MALKTYIWEYLRSEEFDEMIEVSKGVCVMPMGCLEKHGLHLPVGTDITKASRATRMAAEIEPVCVFPDFTFGDVQGHYRDKGGVVLSPDLLFHLLDELCAEIARNGFKKVVIYNSHGGNRPLLNYFLRTLAHTKRDYVVVYLYIPLVSPYQLVEFIDKDRAALTPELNDDDVEVLRDFVAQKKTYGHAGFGETSYMMGICPEFVRLDRLGIESGLSTHKADYLNEAGILMKDSGWAVDFPNKYTGHDPVGCNERIGKCALRIVSEQLAEKLKIIKEEENLLKWNEEFNQSW